MRGDDRRSGSLFSYIDLEQRVPSDHPLRVIRTVVDDALQELSPTFSEIYSRRGRPSIPPERLLRALLLQILHGLRSERQMMERLEFDLLFRWFAHSNQDGQPFRLKVGTCSNGRWALIPIEVGQLAARVPLAAVG